MIACSSNPLVRSLLQRHPRVESVQECSSEGVWFSDGKWDREVFVGRRTEKLFGLVELMDNNPLVCADSMSAPSPAGTLALIALGPLATAGLIQDAPTLIVNYPLDEEDVGDCLKTAGWEGGCLVSFTPHPLDTVLMASASAVIQEPDEPDDISDLFAERYERSFFVHEGTEQTWSAEFVKGRPEAFYQLSIVSEMNLSLVTVRVLADLNGKCGAAQVVHAMNVMCGFEETLGIV